MAQKLILVLSTIRNEDNFIGIFDEANKNWLVAHEFESAISEDFFKIWLKNMAKIKASQIVKIVVDQSEGSFSGARLSTAIANSFKIAFPQIKLFSLKAIEIKVLKKEIGNGRLGLKIKGFIYPKYHRDPSIS